MAVIHNEIRKDKEWRDVYDTKGRFSALVPKIADSVYPVWTVCMDKMNDGRLWKYIGGNMYENLGFVTPKHRGNIVYIYDGARYEYEH